jgi:hypothetical protein
VQVKGVLDHRRELRVVRVRRSSELALPAELLESCLNLNV